MKTKDQRKALKRNKLIPFFWNVTRDKPEYMTAYNWLTGEFRMIEK